MNNKFKKVLSSVAALIMLSGCGKTEEVPVETEVTTTYPPLSEVMSETEAHGADGEATVITEDEAVEIAIKGYSGLNSGSIREMVKYTNVDLYYFISKGEWLSDDELIEVWDNAEQDITMPNLNGVMKNISHMYATHLTEDEIQQYNDFVSVIDTLNSENKNAEYEITDAYRVDVELDDSYRETVVSTDEEGNEVVSEIEPDITNDDNPYFIVVKGNGKWRLDICISYIKERFDMFSSFDRDDYDALVSGSLSAPENSETSESTMPVEQETQETTVPEVSEILPSEYLEETEEENTDISNSPDILETTAPATSWTLPSEYSLIDHVYYPEDETEEAEETSINEIGRNYSFN